jgi:hypothetical protein
MLRGHGLFCATEFTEILDLYIYKAQPLLHEATNGASSRYEMGING